MILLVTSRPKQLLNNILEIVRRQKPEAWEVTEKGMLVLVDWPTRHLRMVLLPVESVEDEVLMLLVYQSSPTIPHAELMQDQVRFVSFLTTCFETEIATAKVVDKWAETWE